MLTYQECEKLFSKCRNKSKGYRLPGRNGATRLIKLDSTSYGIKLYDTVIVEITKNNEYTINHGGYTTKTTAQRIEEYSPFNVTSFCNNWFVSKKGESGIYYSFARTLSTHNGVIYYRASGTRLDSHSMDWIRENVINPYNRKRSQASRERRKALQEEKREAQFIKSVLDFKKESVNINTGS